MNKEMRQEVRGKHWKVAWSLVIGVPLAIILVGCGGSEEEIEEAVAPLESTISNLEDEKKAMEKRVESQEQTIADLEEDLEVQKNMTETFKDKVKKLSEEQEEPKEEEEAPEEDSEPAPVTKSTEEQLQNDFQDLIDKSDGIIIAIERQTDKDVLWNMYVDGNVWENSSETDKINFAQTMNKEMKNIVIQTYNLLDRGDTLIVDFYDQNRTVLAKQGIFTGEYKIKR